MWIPGYCEYELALHNSIVDNNRSLRFSVCTTSVVHTFLFCEGGFCMPDYEKMYFELLHKTENVVKILTEYMRDIANLYAQEILDIENELQ